MLYHGELMPTVEAQEIGLVDEVLAQEEVEDRALKKVAELAALPRKAFEVIKDHRIEAIKIRYEGNFQSKNESFLNCWFSKQTQKLLAEAAKKF